MRNNFKHSIKIWFLLLFCVSIIPNGVYGKDLNRSFKSSMSSMVIERKVTDGEIKQTRYKALVLSTNNGHIMTKIIPIKKEKTSDLGFIPLSTSVFFDENGCSFNSVDTGYIDYVFKDKSQKEKDFLELFFQKKDRNEWDLQGCIISKLDKKTLEVGGNSMLNIPKSDGTNIMIPVKVTVENDIVVMSTKYEYEINASDFKTVFKPMVKDLVAADWDEKMKSFNLNVSVESILKFDTIIKKPLYFKQTSTVLPTSMKMKSESPSPTQSIELVYDVWK